jgi:hypothetical protein
MPQDKNTQLPADSETTLTTGSTEMTSSTAVQEEQTAPAVEAQPKTAAVS